MNTVGSGGEIKIYEGSKPEPESTKALYTEILHSIAEKGDQRIADLLKDNDYEILEIIMSKPITTKTETGYTTRVETLTVVLEKESTGEKYWITIDMESMTVKSIEEK